MNGDEEALASNNDKERLSLRHNRGLTQNVIPLRGTLIAE